jgi:hypothetical protein
LVGINLIRLFKEAVKALRDDEKIIFEMAE